MNIGELKKLLAPYPDDMDARSIKLDHGPNPAPEVLVLYDATTIYWDALGENRMYLSLDYARRLYGAPPAEIKEIAWLRKTLN